MLEYLLVAGCTNKAHQATSERNICMEPSYKTKTTEEPATPESTSII